MNQPAAADASSPPSVARSAGRVGAATLLSRVLGLLREQIFAALVGATPFADAFNVAFRIPNLLRDLFAEGALSAAFVPTFTDYLVNRGIADAWRLANRVLSAVMAVLAVLVLIAMLGAGPLVHAMAPGFDPEKAALTVTLTRIMMPFLILISMAAVSMGMLTSRHHFLETALAPAAFNLVSILIGATLRLAGLSPRAAVIGWSVATLLGGFAQMIVHAPPLYRDGFRFVFLLREVRNDPGIRRILTLMAPATIGLAGVQLNIFFNTIYASAEPGAVSWLNYANRILQLPIGIFAVAIATVTTSSLAHRAASKDAEGLRNTLSGSLRLVLFLTLPATAGLVTLHAPIIRLLYQHGRFNAGDTVHAAEALQLYALGLVAFASVKVIAPAFYALERPRVPLVASLTAVVVNIAFCGWAYLTQAPDSLHRWLPLGTSLTAFVNVIVLLVGFRQVGGPLRWADLWSGLWRMGVASALCGWAAILTLHGAEQTLGSQTFLANGGATLGAIAAGTVAYAAAAALLGIEELGVLVRFVRARRR